MVFSLLVPTCTKATGPLVFVERVVISTPSTSVLTDRGLNVRAGSVLFVTIFASPAATEGRMRPAGIGPALRITTQPASVRGGTMKLPVCVPVRHNTAPPWAKLIAD